MEQGAPKIQATPKEKRTKKAGGVSSNPGKPRAQAPENERKN